MKILWLYSHIQHWLGGSKFVYEVCKEFIKNGHRVTLAIENYSPEIKKKFENAGIEVKSLNTRSSNSVIYWLFFKKNIKKYILNLQQESRNFDLIISSMFPMNYVGNFCRVKHIQIIYEPYAPFWDSDYLKSISLMKRVWWLLMGRLYRQYDISGVRGASYFLTLSEHIRQWAKNIYKRDSKVIYEGVDIDFFKPTYNNELSEKHRDRKIILHNTNFTSYKGTDFLIKAMPQIIRSVPEVKLLITFAIKDRQKINSILKLAKRENFINNLEFLGFVDYALLPSYYSLAAVYVEPGVKRSMSLANKEAMACETPVVTSYYSEEVINEKTGFLVNVNTPGELAEKIIYLLNNREAAKAMGRAGRERIKKIFNWSVVAKRILEFC